MCRCVERFNNSAVLRFETSTAIFSLAFSHSFSFQFLRDFQLEYWNISEREIKKENVKP